VKDLDLLIVFCERNGQQSRSRQGQVVHLSDQGVHAGLEIARAIIQMDAEIIDDG
jgi:hypothetical protein